MILAKKIIEVREQIKLWKRAALSVGLVPTMGYLHEGHASLIDRASQICDRVVVSDFVNPTQFGPNEDLEAYPRDFRRDCALAKTHGCDLIFYPSVEEMYSLDATTHVEVDSEMTKQLCGKSRPTHFRGVCTVVAKLFNIVQPDYAFFGQKDAQQLAVIRKMAHDLSYDVEIVGCPIVREPDGLAKSSRNSYLNEQEREAALVLSRAVIHGKELANNGLLDVKQLLDAMTSIISTETLARIDYIAAVDDKTMLPLDKLRPGVLVALAVYVGKVRLIDNFIVGDVDECL